MSKDRLWRRITSTATVLAVLAGSGSWSAAASAAAPGKHGSPVQAAGDAGWSPSSRPGDTSVGWSAPRGASSSRSVPVDPHAKVVKELTGSRTANADFYQLSDGRVQEKLSATALNYRDAHGAWQPIDSSVRPVTHGGFTAGSEVNSFHTYFSANAPSLVRLEQGSGFVQMGADGAATRAPKVSGSTVSYPGAYPGTDLVYQVGPQGLNESIVLAKAPAPGASYSFTLTVGGFVPRQLADGAIEFYGTEANLPAFTIPAPYMSDAKKDANSPYGTSYSTRVSQSMSWDAKSGVVRLTVKPDAAWLADSHRVYPVTLDPTIVVAPTPSQASNVMILADGPTTNYSTSWRLSVGTTTTGAARALIKFPMPTVPAGTTITSADLRLYYDQTFTTGSNNVPLQALQANAAWNPTTATWSNAGSIGGPVVGTSTMTANALAVWNDFPVTSAVQAWLNGTSANNGFVLKAANEATLGQGGPRYEGSLYAYGGEVVNYPKLVITYGVPGVSVNPPSVIHATGAELSWPAYTNTTGNSANDLAEYQVHRTVFQTFTPGANTLVAPVAAGTTSFVDSTATPTPANNSDPYGNAYYYMVAVKTKSGALIPGPTQLVRLPEAGRTEIVVPSVAATTLSSAQPNSVLNTLSNAGTAQPWLEVGDNSSTYGIARSVFDFGALAQVPAASKIIDAHLKLWQETTTTGTSGAVYEVHGLTRGFTGNQATWNSAATGTAWTTPGGDFGAADGTVSKLTNDPNRQNFDATSIVQGWINTAGSDHGLEVKLAAEAGSSPQERTIFAGRATAEPALAPALVVTYLDPSTGSTYYAPTTPTKMAPGTTYTVPVTINNTTTGTWAASTQQLTYHWTAPDGTDVTAPANQLATALPADLAPGATATINAQVTPPTPADSNAKDQYTLAWDVQNKTTGTYLSATSGIGSLKQATGVAEPGSNQLGLEKFYQYATTATGAGSALYTDTSSGNTVWNDNLFSNPSRGFATFLRLNYNSLDTTDTTTGFGWTVQASTPTRLGQALDFHPNPHPTEVTFTDGTGTSHTFVWNSTTSTWTSPPGVHLYLQQLATCGPQTTNARAWSMTAPDRTVFYYDCEGYPTAVVDKNNNEADFTYSSRQSENKPEEFLSYITDPTSRQTLTLVYYNKGDSYNYIDSSTGNLVAGTNLTNPAIIDHVRSITDISGRTVTFTYTDKGLLGRFVDGDGTSLAKTFNFSYDATQGMKNVKLVAVADPRGNTTKIAYYPNSSPTKWWTQSITDRLNHTAASFAYTEPGSITGSAVQTVVTDANNHVYTYQLDSTGRLIQAVNPLNQKTQLAWDGDNNVTTLTEDNGAQTTWTYDPNTGYPLTHKDALAVKNNTAAATYTYQTALSGHIADVTDTVSAQGRHYHMTYDANGNLLTVQAPDGTAAGSGFTTTYTYDSVGDLLTATDANNHQTKYSNYDPSGYPDTTTDPLSNPSSVVYGPRGEVLSTTDALGHTSTQNYDVFLRPLDGKTPKNQASGVYITTPAPVYDANDNVTQRTAPNGAVSTAVYDADDRATSSTVPPDTVNSPTRTNSYTYDLAGNQLTVTQPDGNVSGATAGSYTTTTAFDALGRPVVITDAVGDKTSSSYDDVGNKITMTDPVKNAIAGNTTYTTQTAYDLDHRATVVTDAAGKTTSTAYDLDGAKISSTDQNNNTTLYSLDQNGRTTQVQVPHTSANGTITYNTTQYTYDQVGNLLATISPRGVVSGTANAYTTKTTYNADNQRTASFGAYNPNDPVYNVAPETDFGYDAAGRLVSTTAPASAGQSVRPVTSLAYYDNGWSKSSTDPFGITTGYDYNALGQQTSRTITSAGGSSSRTMGWSYYPDGKLAGKTDSGIPVGLAVEMVDNSDVQNAAAAGTWTPSSSGTGYQGYNYVTHAAGAGADTFTWNLAVPEDGTYQVYVQYPAVSGAATGASYQISYAGGSGGTATATVDQTKNSGTWVSLGSYAFTAAGTGQKVTLAQNAGGSVTADAVKIVRNNSGDTQPSPNSFAYTYDPNGNLTDVADSSPGALYNDYTYSYDGVNRLAQLQEKASGTVKHATGYTYNADNMPLTMNHDASSATYTYDVRNLLASVINKETSTDAGKSTSYTYAPTGQIATETKANGNVVTDTYNLDDSIAGTVEKTSAGTLVASHTLAYDPNGNETSDASSVQNADNHSAYITKTATDTYTPANQLASVANSDGSNPQSYTYDQAGNITAQSVGGVSTTNVFDRNRLQTSTSSGVTAAYNYDPFGRTDSVTAGGTVIGRFTYDGFDHVSSEVKNTGSGTVTTNYSYDALDRTLTQTDNAGSSGAKTTTFDYLATSSAIADEQVNGSVSKVYQYAATGERLDQIVHNSDGTEDPTYYSYNPHSDVQAITDSTGNTKATYGYSAYGGDDTSGDTGVDKGTGGGATGSTAASPYNVYRFNADRIDGTTGNYNMGFRNYDPSLNRFLTRDMYNGALSDMSMSADPYTGNRYAFGDGNPLSNIELDGHDWCWGCDVALGIVNFGAETIDSVANAIPDLYSLQSGMPASDLWQVDLKTPADNWATNQLEKNNPGWTPDWLDKQVTRGTTDFLNVASLFVGVGEVVDAARGTAAAAKAADAAKEAEAAAAAARAAAKAAQSAEDRALQTAIKDGRVAPGAPVNHLNGAMAEELGWQTALSNGEVGIQGPGKITAVGPDYITYDPATGDINVWDAKYSSTGRFPSGLSASKLSSWMPDVSAAVNGYTGAYQAQIKAAFASGSVRGQIYGYDASKTGWSAP